ncbi:hypothetical protein ABT117_31265 [Streptomyces sp. NPDC002262]|uniref:hypothetical protein n=1 Tax=Streptomyces sp. NPDC002262 TaxID=3154414 RepID=UPI00332994EA
MKQLRNFRLRNPLPGRAYLAEFRRELTSQLAPQESQAIGMVMSRNSSSIKLSALALTLPLSVIFSAPSAYAGTNPGSVLIVHDYYDYAPSIINDGQMQRFWWCGYGPRPDGTMTDAIFYRSYDIANNSWSDIKQVFTPTLGSAWDQRHVCDPSVVQGSFTNPEDGATYQYAMYYGSTNQDDGTNGRIGVAYSNDGVKWTRYDRQLIVPQQDPTTYYGAGQPAVHNLDGKSSIRMFHYDNSHPVHGPRIWIRESSDGVNFSAPTLVTNTGLPHASMQNVDFAYDPATKHYYAAISYEARPGDRETYGFGIYRIVADQLLQGNGAWENLGVVSNETTGSYLNHSPGFMKDVYGNVSGQLLSIGYTQGANDPNTWDLALATWAP